MVDSLACLVWSSSRCRPAPYAFARVPRNPCVENAFRVFLPGNLFGRCRRRDIRPAVMWFVSKYRSTCTWQIGAMAKFEKPDHATCTLIPNTLVSCAVRVTAAATMTQHYNSATTLAESKETTQNNRANREKQDRGAASDTANRKGNGTPNGDDRRQKELKQQLSNNLPALAKRNAAPAGRLSFPNLFFTRKMLSFRCSSAAYDTKPTCKFRQCLWLHKSDDENPSLRLLGFDTAACYALQVLQVCSIIKKPYAPCSKEIRDTPLRHNFSSNSPVSFRTS